jgi:hypothetical protein
LDNYAYDIIGAGGGGVKLDEYTNRCEALKRQASEYVTEHGQRQAALVGDHTSSLLALFGDSKVSQSLFIGYIVAAVTAHDVDWYTSKSWAFWGIQLRAIVAVLGVATLAISGGIQSQVRGCRRRCYRRHSCCCMLIFRPASHQVVDAGESNPERAWVFKAGWPWDHTDQAGRLGVPPELQHPALHYALLWYARPRHIRPRLLARPQHHVRESH